MKGVYVIVSAVRVPNGRVGQFYRDLQWEFPYGVYLEHPLCSYCNVVLLYYIRYYIHYLTPTF